MSKPLVKRIPFAKIVTVLAVAFGVSLGLCGLTAVFRSGMTGIQYLFASMAMIELGVMVLSAVGLLITVAVWVVLSLVGGSSRKYSEIQRLFDDSDDEKKSS